MSEIEKEKLLDKYPAPVTIEGTEKILNQLKNYICKIEIKMVMELDSFAIFHIKMKN